jgi:hypothetical protein
MLKIRSLAAPACRTGACAIVLGAAAALTAGLPAAAWASGPAARPADDSATTITCAQVDPDLPNVMGTSCNSSQWGPQQNFVITSPGGESYQCAAGWAEGTLWVSGQDCTQA